VDGTAVMNVFATVGRMFRGALWRDTNFLRFWFGQTVSEVGTAVTQLALPTLAIELLGARAFQVGILTALQMLAYPLLSMVAGVWADRLHRRPILIACDCARLVVLASIPLAYAMGVLTMAQTYVVALVVGICSVFFDVAYQSYLPSLVRREDLVEGNGKLTATGYVAQVIGPALAGFLIQALRAPLAILADSLSYVASAVSVATIGRPEPPPEPGGAAGSGFGVELSEGVRAVFGHRMLRALMSAGATANLGVSLIEAVILVFAYTRLHLTPAQVGIIYGLASLTAVVGSSVAGRIADTIGLGRTMTIGLLFLRSGYLLCPLALVFHPALVLGGIIIVTRFFEPIFNVNSISLRQAVIRNRIQGRANAVYRTFSWGAIPIGAFLGGILGTDIGLVPTLTVGAVIATLSAIWLLAGPLRTSQRTAVDGG
jgi:MFS family permease